MILQFADNSTIDIISIENISNRLNINLEVDRNNVDVNDVLSMFTNTDKISGITVNDNIYNNYTKLINFNLNRTKSSNPNIVSITVVLENPKYEDKLSELKKSFDRELNIIKTQIFTDVDPDKINNVPDLVEYKISEFGKACKSDIYNGITVTTSEGEENFSLTDEDQANITTAFNIVCSSGLSVPYHANGKLCRLFTASEIVDIYVAAQNFITERTTYCNMLNMMIRNSLSQEFIRSIDYGDELIGEYFINYRNIITSAKETSDAVKATILENIRKIEEVASEKENNTNIDDTEATDDIANENTDGGNPAMDDTNYSEDTENQAEEPIENIEESETNTTENVTETE